MQDLVVGIDVGGTNLRLALVDVDGRIVLQERQPTKISEGLESFIDRLVDSVFTLQGETELRGMRLRCVGAGVPGVIRSSGVVFASPNLKPLEGVNLASLLESRLKLPVRIVNDANAIAYGEKIFGAAKPYASSLTLTLGTGVGSGLVLDGRIWEGPDGAAGEYGHATVEPEGRPCPCGNSGCLERYASATAIVTTATHAVERGVPTVLAQDDAPLTARRVAEAARQGDAVGRAVFEQAGKYLGIAAATAANLLNLEALIIGGGVAESFDLLEPSIRRELTMRAFAVSAARMKILKAALGDDAGLLGSAALAMKELQAAPRG